MKTSKITIFILLLLSSFSSLAQEKTLQIVDAETQKPLKGVDVFLSSKDVRKEFKSDSQGQIVFLSIPEGEYTLSIFKLNYKQFKTKLKIDKRSISLKEIKLNSLQVSLKDMVVIDRKATLLSAASYNNLDKRYIQENTTDRDLPFILRNTPSVTLSSDAGNGIGYTSFRIRGTDSSRISTSINGIPLNDSESMGSYWVDLPDLVASASDIQVQRGVGSSKNGTGNFGASVNINTNEFSKDSELTLHNSYGSFNSIRNSLSYNSGLINDKYFVKIRASHIASDGYIDRASSKLFSYFLSGGYKGTKTKIWLNHFYGKEKTYQAWYGVPESKLETDRTYNIYTYDNQTDNYQQVHNQFFVEHFLKDFWTLKVALHYTHGEGYYEEYKDGESLSSYGLSGGTSDLIRRKWLKNDFYGVVAQSNIELNNSNILFGVAANRYDGEHFDKVVWTPETKDIDHEYNDKPAVKSEVNGFVSWEFQKRSFLFSTDLQYRHVDYSFETYVSSIPKVSLQYDFFNPKVGLSFFLPDHNQILYLSYALANKEPKRADLINAVGLELPKSEIMHDFELGLKKQADKYLLNVNLFYQYYQDQLVPTGELNDVGEVLAKNVAKSYRFGIELFGTLKVKKWANRFSFSWSQNKIEEFVSSVPVYDSSWNFAGYENKTLKNTDIAFSPELVISNELSFNLKSVKLALHSRYVGEQFIDNTSDPSARIKAYFVNDFECTYSFRLKHLNMQAGFWIYNLLGEKYENNAWTFGYIVRPSQEIIRDTNYFPQAPLHGQIFLRIDLKSSK